MRNYRMEARLDTSRDVDNRDHAAMVGWVSTVKLPTRWPGYTPEAQAYEEATRG